MRRNVGRYSRTPGIAGGILALAARRADALRDAPGHVNLGPAHY